jgi:hypothetical protein
VQEAAAFDGPKMSWHVFPGHEVVPRAPHAPHFFPDRFVSYLGSKDHQGNAKPKFSHPLIAFNEPESKKRYESQNSKTV